MLKTWHLQLLLRMSYIHGYHVYKGISEADIDSELLCSQEPDDHEDHCSMAVINSADPDSKAPDNGPPAWIRYFTG